LWYFGTAASSPGLGPLGIANVTDPGVPVNLPRARLDNTYQVTDTLTYTTSNHTVKFGAEFERLQTNENEAFREQGSYTFANLSTFLLGQPASFIGVQPGKSAVRGWRQNLMGLFVQDDVRLKPRLTLNLGLRWEVELPRYVDHNRMNSFDPYTLNPVSGTPGIVTFAGANGVPRTAFDANFGNIGPRFGFAYRAPFAKNLVIRGGAGIFYGPMVSNSVGPAAPLGFSENLSLVTSSADTTSVLALRNGFPIYTRLRSTRRASERFPWEQSPTRQ
jgi:hypothetical protein